jgi:hypothetical protein
MSGGRRCMWGAGESHAKKPCSAKHNDARADFRIFLKSHDSFSFITSSDRI